MISESLNFLKDHLAARLETDNSVPEKVVFVGRDKDTILFTKNAVSVLMVGIEEEKKLRAPDRYLGTSPDGSSQRVQPDVQLNLHVMFVADFDDYAQGLRNLSLIIQHFQQHRVFDQQSEPALSDNIAQLVMELITLPLSEQNDLWSALRTHYHPSVLYKVRMVVYRDEDAMPLPAIVDKDLRGLS